DLNTYQTQTKRRTLCVDRISGPTQNDSVFQYLVINLFAQQIDVCSDTNEKVRAVGQDGTPQRIPHESRVTAKQCLLRKALAVQNLLNMSAFTGVGRS